MTSTPVTLAAAPGALPGDTAMWLLILAELAAFALFFIGFVVARRFNADEFLAGQRTLLTGAGLADTLALITGSHLAVRAVAAMRRRRARACAGWLGAAIAAALVYRLVKG